MADNHLVIAAIVLFAVAPWPLNLTVELAGVRVDQRQPFRYCLRDPKNGYFAYKTFECDGGHVSVMLTRDRRNVADARYGMDFGRGMDHLTSEFTIKDGVVPLATEHGIRIGMTRREVTAKLGPPHKTALRGRNGEYWCAMYKSVRPEGDSPAVLRNTYIFKHGKLVEMSLNLDGLPGCGSDSLSDEGWPWTNF